MGRIISICFLVIAVFLLGVTATGCGDNDTKYYKHIEYSGGTEYKSFETNEKGIPHFSFEYPSTYELRCYQTDTDLKYISVKMTVSSEEEEKGNIGYLQINVDDKFKFENTAINCRLPGAGIQKGDSIVSVIVDSIIYEIPSGDAKLAMDWRIKDIKESTYINNYILLKKNQVNFSGIKGWEVVFSFTEEPLDEYPYENIPIRKNFVPVISRYLYFNYQNMVWEIFLYGAAANDTQNKEDYEHVIKTLKILE
jgi:hypothetical protein